ncbi:hypothetical protein AgCh_020238 [Apium graveolens]
MPVSKTKGEIEARIQQSKDADVGKDRLIKAAEGPNQGQEFSELLVVLMMSLQNNYITYKRALAKNINSIRVVVVRIDNYLEKRIVVNINDVGVDRYLQVFLPNLRTLRAYGLDVVIDKTKKCKIFNVPKNCVRGNMRLIMTLQYDLKRKKNKKIEDEAMIRIFERYLVNADTMFPASQFNLNDDKDDDEQKHDEKKPSGSKPSQSSRATGNKEKEEEMR